jgi:hypothetical protein
MKINSHILIYTDFDRLMNRDWTISFMLSQVCILVEKKKVR